MSAAPQAESAFRAWRTRWRDRLRRALYRARFPGVPVYSRAQMQTLKQSEPDSRAQFAQDVLVHRLFFRGAVSGVFVDVGANHPVQHNNTHFFEQGLGWSGVAVEPIPYFAAQWRQYRRARFVGAAASAMPQTLTLELAGEGYDMFSSIEGRSLKNQKLKLEKIEVPGRPLAQILAEHGLTHINFMSLDVEGFEMDALRGMDFAKVPTDVVLIENNDAKLLGRPAIQRHMKAHGFVHVGRVWELDDLFVARDFLRQHPNRANILSGTLG